jgi:Holliday junction DNA helicase RuvA
MIGYLKGKVIDGPSMDRPDQKFWLLGIESGQSVIGYQIYSPQTSEYYQLLSGKTVEIYVYSHVREDAFDLYGFLTQDEKSIFLSLLNVNGVGPKGALGILSKVELTTLVECVQTQDTERLQKIPGVGKKTAERIILDLGDELKKKQFNFKGSSLNSATSQTKTHSINHDDTKAALLSLGYREQDILNVIKKIKTAASEDLNSSEMIRLALKELSTRGLSS